MSSAKSTPGPKRADLSGRRFGCLVVRSLAYIDQYRAAYYFCDCDCGARGFLSRGARLVSGRTVSCGHLRADPDVRKAAWVKRRRAAARKQRPAKPRARSKRTRRRLPAS